MIPSKAIVREQKQKMEIENEINEKSQNIYNKYDIFWGDEYLNHKKEGAELKEIIYGGVIQDFDLYEKTIQHILDKQLKLNCSQFPLMMSESMGQSVK